MPLTPLAISSLISSKDSPVTWLVPDFLPEGSLVALAGMPGSGKSFLTYTLSLGLATGTPVLGWAIDQPRRVLYCDQENSLPDVTQYFRWAWQGLNCPPLDLVDQNLCFVHFELGMPSWADRLKTYIDTFQPALIVIDTVTPSLNTEDENDNAEATRQINKLRALMRRLDPCPSILALRHAKVKNDGGGYTIRGAKAWEGAVDAVVYQIKPPGRPRKDGLTITTLTPGKTRAFGLRQPVIIHPEWIGGQSGLRLTRHQP